MVAKFGSSVLRTTDDLARAVHEVYGHLRHGRRVLVVVSAIGDTTDRLLGEARALFDRPEPRDLAALLAGGEREAAALFTLALARAGVPALALDPADGLVRARGAILDAEPFAIDRARIEATFARVDVAVLPGFYARGENDGCVLLGRGGSDLTAIFASVELGAERCILLKDVDGLYESDPAATLATARPPRRFASLAFADAGDLDETIVQRKALRLARARGRSFEVAALGHTRGTVVGAAATRLDDAKPTPSQLLRVGLVGLGAVGSAVQRHLKGLAAHFELAAILVHDGAKTRASEVDAALVTTNVDAFFERDFDVLIESGDGHEDSGALVRRALNCGRDVVTANTKLMALDGESLLVDAERCGQSLLFSATVGGAVPALERLRGLVADGRAIAWIAGTLNGAVGFVIDRLERGALFDDAVALAVERGLCQASPALDFDGSDAGRQALLLARAAGARRVRANGRDTLAASSARRAVLAADRGRRLVHVARVDLPDAGAAFTSVRLEELDEHHPLARVRGEQSAVLIGLADGETIALFGFGTGAWPTAESVVGDLLDLAASHFAAKIAR